MFFLQPVLVPAVPYWVVHVAWRSRASWRRHQNQLIRWLCQAGKAMMHMGLKTIRIGCQGLGCLYLVSTLNHFSAFSVTRTIPAHSSLTSCLRNTTSKLTQLANWKQYPDSRRNGFPSCLCALEQCYARWRALSASPGRMFNIKTEWYTLMELEADSPALTWVLSVVPQRKPNLN